MAVATYKGISTVNNNFGSIKLTDTDPNQKRFANPFCIVKVKNL